MFIFILLAIVAVAVIAWYTVVHIKRLRYGNLTLVTGGVKVGKTELSVCLAETQYKAQLRKWRRACRKARKAYEPTPEKPLLYSNMPIGRKGDKYAPITLDLMTGKKRFRYGSVVYFNEVSFIAGSKDLSDEEINDYLLKFWKLCAHETRGGYFFLDTQSPQDMHYTVKRSLSTYYHIYRRVTLPVVSFIWLRENMLVDGENTVAVDTHVDPQDSVLDGGKKMYFRPILNKWWRYYDQYAYSALTDDLPVEDTQVQIDSQKVNDLLRIKQLLKAQGIVPRRNKQ